MSPVDRCCRVSRCHRGRDGSVVRTGLPLNLWMPIGIYRLHSHDSVTRRVNMNRSRRWSGSPTATVIVVAGSSGNRVQRWPGSGERAACLGESCWRAGTDRDLFIGTVVVTGAIRLAGLTGDAGACATGGVRAERRRPQLPGAGNLPPLGGCVAGRDHHGGTRRLVRVAALHGRATPTTRSSSTPALTMAPAGASSSMWSMRSRRTRAIQRRGPTTEPRSAPSTGWWRR